LEAVKLVPEGELKYGRFKSEGKMFEVTPIIEDASGQPMMLPPAVWHVENWVLGYEDWHSAHMPMTFMGQDRQYVPGSQSNSSARFYFMVRILEDGKLPHGVPVHHIDAEAVAMLIQAVKDAEKR
jgi:hypothetical protein